LARCIAPEGTVLLDRGHGGATAPRKQIKCAFEGSSSYADAGSRRLGRYFESGGGGGFWKESCQLVL
jgi:hypothetical protein